MSRKHFVELAAIVRENVDGLPANVPAKVRENLRRTLAKDLGDLCYAQNGRFDRGRFETACGL